MLSPLLSAIVVNVITKNARGVWLMNYCTLTTLFSWAKPWKVQMILELEGRIEKSGFEGKRFGGKRVGRRTVQKQDRPMWSW